MVFASRKSLQDIFLKMAEGVMFSQGQLVGWIGLCYSSHWNDMLFILIWYVLVSTYVLMLILSEVQLKVSKCQLT